MTMLCRRGFGIGPAALLDDTGISNQEYFLGQTDVDVTWITSSYYGVTYHK